MELEAISEGNFRGKWKVCKMMTFKIFKMMEVEIKLQTLEESLYRRGNGSQIPNLEEGFTARWAERWQMQCLDITILISFCFKKNDM